MVDVANFFELLGTWAKSLLGVCVITNKDFFFFFWVGEISSWLEKYQYLILLFYHIYAVSFMGIFVSLHEKALYLA